MRVPNAWRRIPSPPRPQRRALTLALVAEVTGPIPALHSHGQVPVHADDVTHRLRPQQDDTVVTLTPSHCAVLQGPGLIHLERRAERSPGGLARPTLTAAATASGPPRPGQGCPRLLAGPVLTRPDPARLPPAKQAAERSPRGWGLCRHPDGRPRPCAHRRAWRFRGEAGDTPVGVGWCDRSRELGCPGEQRPRSPRVRGWSRRPGSGRCHSAGCRWLKSGSPLRRSCCRWCPLRIQRHWVSQGGGTGGHPRTGRHMDTARGTQRPGCRSAGRGRAPPLTW